MPRRPKNLNTREQKLSWNEYRMLLEKRVENKTKEIKRGEKVKVKERTKKNNSRSYSSLFALVFLINDFRIISLVWRASLLGSASALT